MEDAPGDRRTGRSEGMGGMQIPRGVPGPNRDDCYRRSGST